MKRKSTWQEHLPAALFSFFLVFGYSFAKTDSWEYIFGSMKDFLASALAGILLYMVFLWGIRCLFDRLGQEEEHIPKPVNNKPLSWFLDRRPFLGAVMFLTAAWCPYLIAQYPAGMGHDAYSQLNQALGYSQMTSHHPPFHTFWIGFCVKVGRRLGSMNLGIFLYVLTQAALAVGAIACFMWWLRQRGMSWKLRLAVLLFFGFFPLFPMYAATVIKDVPYSFVYLIYVLLFLEIAKDIREEKQELWRHLTVFGGCSLLLMLLRVNGIYLAVPSAAGVLLFGKKFWKKGRKLLLKAVFLLFLPVGIFLAYQDWLLPKLGVVPGSIAMAFSIPFQQTARYARDYPEEVTEEEKAIINEVLDYDYLATLYNPNLSDPLTYMYRDPEKEELAAYFQLWFRQFLRHPGVYVEATMNNVYGMFYPGVDNTIIFFDLLEEYGYNNFEQPRALAAYRQKMAAFTEGALRFPGLHLLNNMALWVWIFLLEFFFCWKEKRWDAVVAGIPALMTILVCIAGPAIFGHPRYVFPIVLQALTLLPSSVRSERRLI